MFRLSLCRPALVLALALFLATPWDAAAWPRLGGTRSRAAVSESAGPDLFSGFLSFFARIWEKAGCIIDPHGQCIPAPQVENGCGIDPHGACAPVQVENGCTIDPHGGCAPVQVENGCGIDPSGGCVSGQ